MVVGQGSSITRFLNANKQRLMGQHKEERQSKHFKSIALDQKSLMEYKNEKYIEKPQDSYLGYNTVQNRSIVEAIGPQKTKTQTQANQNTAKDDDISETEFACTSEKP